MESKSHHCGACGLPEIYDDENPARLRVHSNQRLNLQLQNGNGVRLPPPSLEVIAAPAVIPTLSGDPLKFASLISRVHGVLRAYQVLRSLILRSRLAASFCHRWSLLCNLSSSGSGNRATGCSVLFLALQNQKSSQWFVSLVCCFVRHGL